MDGCLILIKLVMDWCVYLLYVPVAVPRWWWWDLWSGLLVLGCCWLKIVHAFLNGDVIVRTQDAILITSVISALTLSLSLCVSRLYMFIGLGDVGTHSDQRERERKHGDDVWGWGWKARSVRWGLMSYGLDAFLISQFACPVAGTWGALPNT